MKHAITRPATTLLLLLACLFLAAPASAQHLVARVNGSNITSYDVAQRIKLQQLVEHKRISPKQALDLLIDDKLKQQEARRIGFRITEDDVDKELTRIATSNRQTKDQLEQGLRQAGVDPSALRDRIAADLAWNSLLPYKTRSIGASNADINAEIQKRLAKGEGKVIDYTVNQVIFVVPGANPGIANQRMRDAAAARGRFNGCEAGLSMLRQMRDVAVKPTVFRTSLDLPKQMNDLLAKTAIGHLTEPYRSDQGIEMIAVCDRKERNDEAAIRTQVENELNQKRRTATGESILKELREKAYIKRF